MVLSCDYEVYDNEVYANEGHVTLEWHDMVHLINI